MKKMQRHSMCFSYFVLFCFFPSVFNDTGRPWATWSPESEHHECGNCEIPFVDTVIVRDQLYQLNVHKSVGSDGIHPRVLKKWVDIPAGPLSITYQRIQESGKVPAHCKLVSVTPVCRKDVRKDSANYRCVSLTSVSGKIIEIILGMFKGLEV